MVQIIDLRPEWADYIAKEVSTWNCRYPPPIRLLAEIFIAGTYWLRTLDSAQKPPPLNFRETRPPWLSTPGSVEDPTMQIERLTFSGWLWETYHSLRVTGSSRDDKAGINIILWAF